MKRFGLIAALMVMFFGFCGTALAQYSSVPDLKGRVIYGGNFGFGMSGNYLSLSIAPQVGYRVFNPWEVGIRGIYDLTCWFDRYNGTDYGHYFGVAPYTNFQVFKGLFLHVEDEVLYGFHRWNHSTVSNKWYNSVFAGVGYRAYSYTGSFSYFMVLVNLTWLLDTPSEALDTPYASPISLRVGYCF